MKLKVYEVLVQRTAIECIPTTVFEHEFPILQQVHSKSGPEAVQLQEEGERDIKDFEVDAEYDRMAAKYGKHPDTKRDYVEMVYGLKTTGGLARSIGIEPKALLKPKVTAPKKVNVAELRAG